MQNRASQRAFRERKESHVKGLESQLQELHEKHQNLLQAYSRQGDEVTRLNQRIKELTSELELLRSASEMSFGNMLLPQKFDAVP
jgi:predicted nuclease with TOPRIM domain